MIDNTFLDTLALPSIYHESGFSMKMDFYALSRSFDLESMEYLEDICKIYDGMSKHCDLLNEMGYEDTAFHKELGLVKSYITHLHMTYHSEASLDEVIRENIVESDIDYPKDFDPPEDEIEVTFIDDLEVTD